MKSLLMMMMMMLIASCGEGCVQDRKGTPSSIHGSLTSIRVVPVFRVHTCLGSFQNTGQRRGGRVPNIVQDAPPSPLPRWSKKKSVAIRAYAQPAWKILRQASICSLEFFAFLFVRTPGRRDQRWGWTFWTRKGKTRDQLLSATWDLLFVF